MLNRNKEKFQTPKTGKRAVNSTIINRAYYSAYSYAYIWLEEKHKFKPKQKWEFEEDGERYITEHAQVKNELKKYKKDLASQSLYTLHDLRKKADYHLFNPLTENEVKKSIILMKVIFNELKF